MNYQEASELGPKINNLCGSAIFAVEGKTPTKRPLPNAEAVIFCSRKLPTTPMTAPAEVDFCRIMNESACPAGISLERLQGLKT
jgi:hypothetical protein